MKPPEEQAAEFDKRAQEATTFLEAQALSSRADQVRKRTRLLRLVPSSLPLFRN